MSFAKLGVILSHGLPGGGGGTGSALSNAHEFILSPNTNTMPVTKSEDLRKTANKGFDFI